MRNLALSLALASCVALPGVALAADTYGKQPVKTVTIGDVTIELAGGDGSTVAQVSANNGAAIGNGITALVGQVNSSLPTYTAGRAAAPSIDTGGRVYVTGDASMTALANNITKVGGSSLALGQTTMANSIPVAIASNQGNLSVTQGAPTGSSFNVPSVVNIGSGSSSTITCKGSLAVSQTTRPIYWQITSGGAVRCTLQYNDNASITKFTNVATTPGFPTATYSPLYGTVGLTTSSTATTQQYEASCTNFDSTAQDVYCSISYCQAASGC